MAARRPVRLQLALLGGFALSRDGAPVVIAPVEQRLLACLELTGRQTRQTLAGTLWGESDPGHAQGSLRSVLWRLRRAHGPLVQVTGETVTLAPELETDVRELETIARDVLSGDVPTRTSTDPEVPCGPLLPGWSEEWLHVPRERVRQLQLHLWEALGQDRLRHGQYGLALEVAMVALAMDPLRESAHRLVVDVHLAEGNVAEARQQYERCRRLLATELGIRPSLRLQEVMAGLPGLVNGPPPPGAPPPRHAPGRVPGSPGHPVPTPRAGSSRP